MSLDCKLSSINGKLPAKFKMRRAKESLNEPICVRKWIRNVLLFWLFGALTVGSVLFCLSFAYVVCEDGKVKIQTFSYPETLTVQKTFNVTQNLLLGLASEFSESDQMVALECTKGPISGMKLNHGISCSVKILRSKNSESRMLQKVVQDNVEMTNKWPFVQEETIPRKRSYLSLFESRYAFHALQYIVSATSHIFREIPFQPGQYRLLCDLIKQYWWVLVIGALSFKVASDSWHQMLIHEQPQKPPLLSLGPPKGAGKWMKLLLVLFYVAGVTVSIWLFWHFSTKDTSRREETLVNMCDERARMLQDQFNVSMNHVHALALLVSTFHHGKDPSAIDQKTFGEYAERTSFERPLTSGVAYALKVVHSERERFENQHGWTIKKMEAEDQTLVQDCVPENLDPAPIKDEYAPVIFSQETVSHIVSIDMMSGKEDRENILRARATGKGVLTSPFKLLKSNHLGVVLTFAVYNKDMPSNATPEQRVEATMGYLGASYDVPSLVEKLLHQLASKETIVVNVYDTTNSSSPINMFGDDVIDTGFLRVSPLDFGDPLRSHEMHCRFKQQPPLPWTAINASVVVLVITFLVGHIFHAAIIRIAKVEADYRMMVELKARAEAADVAKSQFLATVSHEIRTPMNGVLGMLQMLMDTELDATQQDFAYTAHASGKDLISLINEVLDQAKIESGRLELEDVPFDLRAVLDNVLSLFSGKSNEKGIELAVYVSSRVPDVVIGDPGRFRQIITNLVGNSIKFTDDRGHIFVTVHLAEEVKSAPDSTEEALKQRLGFVQSDSNQMIDTLSGYPVVKRWKSWEHFKNLVNTTPEESDTVKLLVTVEDTGVGIPIEAQDRIFTPFVQADSSTSRTYGGTGIGLSISKCLVELMGGEIGFVSEPGTGSTFAFTGCLRKGETSSLDPKWQQCDPNTLEFRGLKSLVVDKSIVRAEVCRYHLERLGISVDIASDMESACSYISSASNHGALTGLAMVLIDKDVWDKETCRTFQQLLQRQRENGSTETLMNPPKIFLLTTSISPSERNALKSAGLVDNILAKPLRLSVLNACFLEALASGKKRALNRKKLPTLGTLLSEKRILVVDDNIVNRRVAEGALKKYGALVTCVDSGKAALQKLEPPHHFDACFMDLRMPEMDGFEATQRIRSKESKINEEIASGEALPEKYGNIVHWHTPILAMTADVIQVSNEQCMKCGMDDYVLKPFDEGQLYSALARFFKT